MSARHPDKPAGTKPRRLTETQIADIIDHVVNGHSYRATADIVGCNRDTVKAHWDKYIASINAEAAEQFEPQRLKLLAQLENVASQALKEATTPREQAFNEKGFPVGDPHATKARYLNVATRALAERSRIAGYDAPKQVQVSGQVQMTETEAALILAQAEADQ